MTQDALFADDAVPAVGALVVAATDGPPSPRCSRRCTVTWSKVKSHTRLSGPEHVLDREADARAGAAVAALHAGTPPVTGQGWTARPGSP